MTKRFLLAGIVTMMLVMQGMACSLAYEHRIFPLGSVKGDLIYLETRLTRDAENAHGSDPKVFWSGEATLMRGPKVMHVLTSNIRFNDEDYVTVIDSLRYVGWVKADEVKGFTALVSLREEICEPSNSCGSWSLRQGEYIHASDGVERAYQQPIPANVKTAADWLTGDISTFSFKLMAVQQVRTRNGDYCILRLSGGEDYEGLAEALATRKSISPKEVHYEHGICYECIIPISPGK